MLLEQGVTPERFSRETIFAGGHDQVTQAVLDAGAIYDGALGVAQQKGIPVETLLTLARTEPILHDAIAVRVGLDEALVRKIQTALVTVDKTEAGRRALVHSRKKLTGHAVAEDSLFDGVRRTARLAGM